MVSLRRNPVLRPRLDGRYDLVVGPEAREVVDHLLGGLDERLAADPGDPALRRLRPPAYLEDPELDAGYQLLAGAELVDSHRRALDEVRASLQRDVLTEDDVWTLLRALNSVRIVLATTLDVDDDEHEPPEDPDHPQADLWDALEFATQVQQHVLDALG